MSSPDSFSGHAPAAAPPPPGVTVRHDWTLPEVRALYALPLLELVHQAQSVHRAVFTDNISTRTYEDRLRTLGHVRGAGISVCCGGIIGMGESVEDRCHLLLTLANQEVHPESVPINALVPVEGTPLAHQKRVETLDMVRTIATARLLMPQAMVRLSAGRMQMNEEAQLLCMLAGANSLFFGEKLLTTGNPEYTQDMALLEKAGIRPLEPDLSR